MKKIIFFLALFSILPAFFPSDTNAKENSHTTVRQLEENYIYVTVVIDGRTFVFVYLSDGITLVNVYEDED